MPEKKKSGVTSIVTQIAGEITESLELELWDVRFEKEGASWYLRVFIDKDGGITYDDCEAVSKKLDKLLDELDPIESSYFLEVSSPGVERMLVKPAHFKRFSGAAVRVRFIRAVDGQREYVGRLGFEDGYLSLAMPDGKKIEFKKTDTSYIKLYNDFDGGNL